jgi:hypothetical protein
MAIGAAFGDPGNDRRNKSQPSLPPRFITAKRLWLISDRDEPGFQDFRQSHIVESAKRIVQGARATQVFRMRIKVVDVS